MKTTTLEKLIKYTRTPYPVIIERALKGGWHMVSTEEYELDGFMFREVRIEDNAGHFYRVAYEIDNPETSAFNEYGWPKQR